MGGNKKSVRFSFFKYIRLGARLFYIPCGKWGLIEAEGAKSILYGRRAQITLAQGKHHI